MGPHSTHSIINSQRAATKKLRSETPILAGGPRLVKGVIYLNLRPLGTAETMFKTQVQKRRPALRKRQPRDDLQATGDVVRPANPRIHHDVVRPSRLIRPHHLHHHVECRTRRLGRTTSW